MVVVCCLKSLLVLFDVTVSCLVWQVLHKAIRFSMVSRALASTHSSRFNVMYVLRCCLRRPRTAIQVEFVSEAHRLEIDLWCGSSFEDAKFVHIVHCKLLH
jgi:hypothetical protein